MTTSLLYYEAHITIDPVPEDQREHVQMAADPVKFRLAKLLMDKGVPSRLDTFLTGHGTDLADIKRRTRELVESLQVMGYTVRRYKIEDTILDSRHSDIFSLLNKRKSL